MAPGTALAFPNDRLFQQTGYTQTLKGIVLDKGVKTPLAGAAVQLVPGEF